MHSPEEDSAMNFNHSTPAGAGGRKAVLSKAVAGAALARIEEEERKREAREEAKKAEEEKIVAKKQVAAAAKEVERQNEIAREREARARHQKAREAARKEEEESLEVKKQAAAAASEALERKQAIKTEEAKEAARLAAEERAATTAAAAAAALVENVNKTSVRSHHMIEGKEIVNATSNSVVNTNLANQTETEMQNETTREREARARSQKAREALRREEEEKLETMKKAAAKASEALEKSDEIKSAQAREAARLAAEERFAKVSHTSQHSRTNIASAPSQPKIAKKEIVSGSREQHHMKESSRGSNNHGVNEVNEIQTPASDSTKTSSQGKDIVNVTNYTKHTLMESSEGKLSHDKHSRTTMHNSNKDEKSIVHPADQDGRQRVTRDYVENLHAQLTGTKPKERTLEHSEHGYLNQYERSNAQWNTTTTTVEPRQRPGYSSSEKEIVSVTGDEKSNKLGSGRKEDEMNQNVKNGSPQRMNKTHTEESKEEHSQRFPSDTKSHQREGMHGHRTPRHHAPPPMGNRSYNSSHHHNYSTQHHHHLNPHWNDHRNSRVQQTPPPKNHRQAQQQEQQRSSVCGSSRKLICGSCNEKYNFKEKMPRELYCRHSMCTSCIRQRTNPDFMVSCPHCLIYTWNIKEAHWCPINEFLIQILGDEIQKDVYMEEIEDVNKPHSSAGSDRRQAYPQHKNDGNKQPMNKYNAPSPHNSKCIEVGVHPTHYCSTCKVWVCGMCAETEHMTRKCSLKTLKVQFSEMKQNYDLTFKGTQEFLKKSMQSLENDYEEEKIFQLWMRATFECMEKKQENIKKSLQEGRELMSTLIDVMQTVPNAQNLPEALATFQILEDVAGEAHQWSSSAVFSGAGADDERTACLRSLMKRTLKSVTVTNGISDMHAADKIPDTELFSELTVDGGRFHLHALRKGKPTKPEARALPVQCFKFCQDAASMLVFLDLSWGGKCHGRLYIRLTGDTLRGRQFISLCIGEGCASFRATRFHRVWWKGLPGEHVWTGDYENSDGSGSKIHPSSSMEVQIPAAREVPISAGLVAGRYEKENLSSIFRIYTRGEKEMRDEAGFGQVEFGLDVMKEAVMLRNICEVMISDCGLVLEM